jgi:hypothetical protein
MPWQNTNRYNIITAGTFVKRIARLKQCKVTANVLKDGGIARIILLKGWQSYVLLVPSTEICAWHYHAIKIHKNKPFVVIGNVTQYGVNETFAPIDFDIRNFKVTLNIIRD